MAKPLARPQLVLDQTSSALSTSRASSDVAIISENAFDAFWVAFGGLVTSNEGTVPGEFSLAFETVNSSTAASEIADCRWRRERSL
jgi:hypothetical protein